MSDTRDYKSELNVVCQGCDFDRPVYKSVYVTDSGSEPGWQATVKMLGKFFCSRSRLCTFRRKIDAEQCAAELALWYLHRKIEKSRKDKVADKTAQPIEATVYAQNAASVKARVSDGGGVVTISGPCAKGIKPGQRILFTAE